MALDPVTFAADIKTKVAEKLAALDPPITVTDSPITDAYYAAIAEAIIDHFVANAEVLPGTFNVSSTAVDGEGTLS